MAERFCEIPGCDQFTSYEYAPVCADCALDIYEGRIELRPCLGCGLPFPPKSGNNRFCCKECGPVYYARARLEHEITDREVLANGYVQVRVAGSWHPEHTVVMERALGRNLAKGESVHHKNGIRHDNRADNLELWVGPIRHGIRAREFHCPHCGEPWVYPEEPGA